MKWTLVFILTLACVSCRTQTPEPPSDMGESCPPCVTCPDQEKCPEAPDMQGPLDAAVKELQAEWAYTYGPKNFALSSKSQEIPCSPSYPLSVFKWDAKRKILTLKYHSREDVHFSPILRLDSDVSLASWVVQQKVAVQVLSCEDAGPCQARCWTLYHPQGQ